jgi:hypothetical protein
MKSTKGTRKLSLAIEKIRELGGNQLGGVRGGSRWEPCGTGLVTRVCGH